MESNLNGESLDEISSKHRKEKKELQSTIQSLKKSASKGDKKKRKEILEEISRLEIDLEKKQAKQLQDHQNEVNAQNPNVNVPPENVDKTKGNPTDADDQPRISKAQKRRNKKALEEKEREANILAQEEQNINGPRMLEKRAIEEILQKRNLRLHSIASDGDCLYNAIQHQLQLTGRGSFTLNQLRHQTANFIMENKQNLIFYMTNSNTGEILTDEDFIKYCENIKNSPAWGGQVEIKALSSAFRVPIEVIQANGPSTIQGTEYQGPPLVVTYHRLMYSLGEHYNSTSPLTENDEDANEEYEKEENNVFSEV